MSFSTTRGTQKSVTLLCLILGAWTRIYVILLPLIVDVSRSGKCVAGAQSIATRSSSSNMSSQLSFLRRLYRSSLTGFQNVPENCNFWVIRRFRFEIVFQMQFLIQYLTDAEPSLHPTDLTLTSSGLRHEAV